MDCGIFDARDLAMVLWGDDGTAHSGHADNGVFLFLVGRVDAVGAMRTFASGLSWGSAIENTIRRLTPEQIAGVRERVRVTRDRMYATPWDAELYPWTVATHERARRVAGWVDTVLGAGAAAAAA